MVAGTRIETGRKPDCSVGRRSAAAGWEDETQAQMLEFSSWSTASSNRKNGAKSPQPKLPVQSIKLI